MKVELDNNTPVILSNYKEVEKSLEEAKDAYKLTSGTLEGKESVTYELRIWIDEDTPASDETSEASFLSKVSVITSPTTEEDITNDIQIAIESTTIDYNKEKEDFSINAVSSKVNLISYLFSDNKLTKEELKQEMNWSLILPEDKTFTTTKSFTEEGTNYIYIKDEYGNIEESEIEVSKIDREGPRVIEITKGEEWGAKSTITAKVIDDKSGFIGYALVLGSNEPNEYETVENTKNEYTITKEVNENGTYTLWMKDNLGNISKEEIEISNIDTIAPVISDIENSSNGNWVNTSIDLSWAITESESGIGKVQISTDGTNFSDLPETEWNGKTFDNERNDTIYIRAIDKAGNISNVVSTPLKIDKSAPSKPVLESTFTDGSGAYTSGSWTNKSVNIKSTSSDTLSGGVKTYYSYNQNEWYEDWNGTNSAVVIGTWTGEYDRTIYFKAVDAVGNESEYATILLRIDKSAPIFSYEAYNSVAGNKVGSNQWYKAFNFKVKLSDGGSGVADSTYCITTDAECTPGVPQTTKVLSSNEYIVKFGSNSQAQRVCIKVSDLAGNISDKVCTWNVLVDGEAPTNVMNIKTKTEGNNGWYKELTLVVDVGDKHSGVASARYCFTTGDKCDPDRQVSISSDNSYTVTFESNKAAQKMCVNVTDKAGNTSGEYCSGKFSVDTVLPKLNITTNQNVNEFTFKLSDVNMHSYTRVYVKCGNKEIGYVPIAQNISFRLDSEGPLSCTIKSKDDAGWTWETTARFNIIFPTIGEIAEDKISAYSIDTNYCSGNCAEETYITEKELEYHILRKATNSVYLITAYDIQKHNYDFWYFFLSTMMKFKDLSGSDVILTTSDFTDLYEDIYNTAERSFAVIYLHDDVDVLAPTSGATHMNDFPLSSGQYTYKIIKTAQRIAIATPYDLYNHLRISKDYLGNSGSKGWHFPSALKEVSNSVVYERFSKACTGLLSNNNTRTAIGSYCMDTTFQTLPKNYIVPFILTLDNDVKVCSGAGTSTSPYMLCH